MQTLSELVFAKVLNHDTFRRVSCSCPWPLWCSAPEKSPSGKILASPQIILEFQMMTDLVARDKNRWEHVGEGVWNATDMTFRRVGELLFNSLIFNFLGNSGNILFFYQDFEFCLFVFRPSVVMWSAGNEPRSYRKEIFWKPIFWRSSWRLKLHTFGWPGRYFDQEPKWILLC